jgi:hypothetical protein
MGETTLHLRSVTFCIQDRTIDKFIFFSRSVVQILEQRLNTLKELEIWHYLFSEFVFLPHNSFTYRYISAEVTNPTWSTDVFEEIKLFLSWRNCLRHCSTSRKVAGSIPDGVIGIFHWHNPSGRNMALGLTQPLTEMRTRNVSWR